MKNINSWDYNKKVRELSQDIENAKIHAKREIENNKVCAPNKVRYNSQRYLEVVKQRYRDFIGDDYE